LSSWEAAFSIGGEPPHIIIFAPTVDPQPTAEIGRISRERFRHRTCNTALPRNARIGWLDPPFVVKDISWCLCKEGLASIARVERIEMYDENPSHSVTTHSMEVACWMAERNDYSEHAQPF
jgi:hypothetical protein